jgi:hypothetical protein
MVNTAIQLVEHPLRRATPVQKIARLHDQIVIIQHAARLVLAGVEHSGSGQGGMRRRRGRRGALRTARTRLHWARAASRSGRASVSAPPANLRGPLVVRKKPSNVVKLAEIAVERTSTPRFDACCRG